MSHATQFPLPVYRIDRPDGRQRFLESAEEPVVDLARWGTRCTRIDTDALTPAEAIMLRVSLAFDSEAYTNALGLRAYLAWILDPAVRRSLILEEARPAITALQRQIVQAPGFEDESAEATIVDALPVFAEVGT